MRITPWCALLIAGACAPNRPPGSPVIRDATAVNASFGRTWDAVIDVFAEQNIPIRTMERASGFIAAERTNIAYDTPEDPAYGEQFADCGTVGRIVLIPGSATYNIVVRGDSTRSTVKVTVKYLNHGVDRTRTTTLIARECATRGVFESATEEALSGALRRDGSAARPSPSTAGDRCDARTQSAT